MHPQLRVQTDYSLYLLRQLATSLELSKKEGLIFSIMTTVKINVDKVSLKVLFKTMAKMNDDMNETSFVHSITKCRLQIKAQAQAAAFYTPNQFSDTIVLKKGCQWMRDWPDHDLVNTKKG